MPQWVGECLLCKHENLSSNHQHSSKKLGIAACACNLFIAGVETDRNQRLLASQSNPISDLPV